MLCLEEVEIKVSQVREGGSEGGRGEKATPAENGGNCEMR